MKKALLLRAYVNTSDGNRAPAGPWLSLVRKGELTWMAIEWPELQAFLATHDLASNSSGAADEQRLRRSDELGEAGGVD